jgi:hypothetical protein
MVNRFSPLPFLAIAFLTLPASGQQDLLSEEEPEPGSMVLQVLEQLEQEIDEGQFREILENFLKERQVLQREPNPSAPPGAESKPPVRKQLSDEDRKAQALLQRHLQVRFQRPGSQILLGLARKEGLVIPPGQPGVEAMPPGAAPPVVELAEPAQDKAEGRTEPDPLSRAVEGFRRSVVTGDWQAVKSYLAALSPKVAEKVYSHLIGSLQNDQQVVLLPSEVLPLADAAPSAPREEEIQKLGRILARSLRAVDAPRLVLARLEEGTRYLGGREPERRIAAARLLLGADLIAEAQGYLPPLGIAPVEGVPARDDPKLLNLHALFLETVGRKKQDPQAIQKARSISIRVLEDQDSGVDPRTRLEALQRALGLLSTPPAEESSRWLRDLFRQKRGLAYLALAETGVRLEGSYLQRIPAPRIEALKLLRQIVGELLQASADDPAPWSMPLQVLTLGWLNEAHKSLSDAGARGGRSPRRDFSDPEQPAKDPRLQNPEDQKTPPLSPADVFAQAPDETWCRRLEGDLAHRARRLTALLAARAGDEKRAEAIAGFMVRDDPQAAKEIAEETVRAWSARAGKPAERESNYSGRSYRYGRYSPNPWMYQDSGSSEGIPLTRARQVRNLRLLGELLASFRALGVPPLDPAVVVQAFEAGHSPAEVYRREDLESVFGDPASLPPEALWSLVSSLRQKLAGQWRQVPVQEEAKTRRSDEELAAEIDRGYELGESLLGDAGKAVREWRLQLLLATLLFDRSEFLYGRKVDLETYVRLRDRSFRTYREAAAAYARAAEGLDPAKETAEPHFRWFQSSLGASDLAFLTRQDKPDGDQIQAIRASLSEGGEERAARHLELFGKELWEGTSELPPQLKPLYLREGLRVLRDHPAGKSARDLLTLYQDLLGEVELALQVDGDATVGHRRRFGARLSIRHSQALGRESGGFNRFLLNKQYSPAVQRELNYRDDLEKALRESLAQGFEVEAIRFLEPGVEPRGYGRPGWQETPLAYLVLKARDPSVDRIPPVQVDLEFQDGRGLVLLPVTSPVTLIDARDPNPPSRPVAELQVRQLLDGRGEGEGLLVLEVIAGGRGLIPELEEIIDLEKGAGGGFAIRSLQDQGLSVESLATEGKQIEPVTRRSWRLELSAAGKEPPASFVFPEVKEPAAKVRLEQFADADLVEAPKVVVLGGPGLTRRAWPWIAGCGAAAFVAALLVAAVVRRSRRRKSREAGPRYLRPEALTPFSLLGLLERMHADPELALRPEERAALEEAIRRTESSYFSRTNGAAPEPDLDALAREWIARAGGRSRF